MVANDERKAGKLMNSLVFIKKVRLDEDTYNEIKWFLKEAFYL